MAQARRRKPHKTKATGPGWVQRYLHPCWLMLLIGLFSGSVSTWLYLGWHGADVGMGHGLKTLLHATPTNRQSTNQQTTRKTAIAKPKYDFYTRLLRDTPLPQSQFSPQQATRKPLAEKKPVPKSNRQSVTKPTNHPQIAARFKPGVSYMLQAGSYPGFTEADKLRARLALRGLESHIEKTTIQGKGFYRVRLGPYFDSSSMQRDRIRLQGMGVVTEQIQQRRRATSNPAQ